MLSKKRKQPRLLVRLYVYQLDTFRFPNNYTESLTSEEKKSFKNNDHRKKCRYILRTLLSKEIGGHPRDITLLLSQKGKPYLSPIHQTGLQFNISHTKTHLAIALSTSPIGIDIETIKPTPKISAIAKKIFTHDEQVQLSKKQNNEKNTLFYTLWTKKESSVKLLGDSIFSKQNGATSPYTSFPFLSNMLKCAVSTSTPHTCHVKICSEI